LLYKRGILAGFFTKHFDTECQAFETRYILNRQFILRIRNKTKSDWAV